MNYLAEEPNLVFELAIAETVALQKEGIAATAMHFAVHSEPKGGRDGVNRSDPHVAPRELRMLHLYPWERLVHEAGLLGAMVWNNDYDPIAGSHEFMIDLLRNEWGFQGYLVSDSGAVKNLANKHRVAATHEDAAAMWVAEGWNVRTMFDTPGKFILPLRQAIADGKLPPAALGARVADVLRVKFLIGLFDRPCDDARKADAANHTPSSQALALRAAHESIVLLKNTDHTLPLSKTKAKRVQICDPTADFTETPESR